MRRPSRRGANAIEFALIMPILVAMLAGMMDYGWFFWREAMLINGMREAVRAGGMQTQLEAETGSTCSSCITVAQAVLDKSLKDQGYSGVSLTPKMERIPTSGTPCAYTVVISGSVPHTRLFTLIPGPTAIKISIVSIAQNVKCT